MISVRENPCFRLFVLVQQPADADCVISISTIQNYEIRFQKIGTSWHAGNIPILIEKTKLSVYFRRARTSLFFDTWFSSSKSYSIDISHSSFADCWTNTKCRKHGISPSYSHQPYREVTQSWLPYIIWAIFLWVSNVHFSDRRSTKVPITRFRRSRSGIHRFYQGKSVKMLLTQF